MPKYVLFGTGYWKHPDIQDLNRIERFVYAYLFTNESCTQSGVYPITVKTIANEIDHQDFDKIRDALNGLEKKEKIFMDWKGKTIFVKNFLKHNQNGRKDLILRSIQNDMLINLTFLWDRWKEVYEEFYQELKDYSIGQKKIKINKVARGKGDSEFSAFVDEVVKYWNERVCKKENQIPQISELTLDRKEKIRMRTKEDMPWKEVFEKIINSQWLRGLKADVTWRCTFDWVFKNDKNWRKIIEGNYDDKKPAFAKHEYKIGQKFYKETWEGQSIELKNRYKTKEINVLKDGNQQKAVEIVQIVS